MVLPSPGIPKQPIRRQSLSKLSNHSGEIHNHTMMKIAHTRFYSEEVTPLLMIQFKPNTQFHL